MKTKNRAAAILFILAAAFFMALQSCFVRLAGDLPAMQKCFVRNIVTSIFAFVILKRSGVSCRISKKALPLYLARSVCGVIGGGVPGRGAGGQARLFQQQRVVPGDDRRAGRAGRGRGVYDRAHARPEGRAGLADRVLLRGVLQCRLPAVDDFRLSSDDGVPDGDARAGRAFCDGRSR